MPAFDTAREWNAPKRPTSPELTANVIGWYDGFVSGIVGADGVSFICLLLAPDVDTARCRYALIPVIDSIPTPTSIEQFAAIVKSALETIREKEFASSTDSE